MKKINVSIKNINLENIFLISFTTALSSAILSDLFYKTIDVAQNHMIGLFLNEMCQISINLFVISSVMIILNVLLKHLSNGGIFIRESADFVQGRKAKSNVSKRRKSTK